MPKPYQGQLAGFLRSGSRVRTGRSAARWVAKPACMFPAAEDQALGSPFAVIPRAPQATEDDVAVSTSREALTGARRAMAAVSLITLLVIGCGGVDTPTATAVSESGTQPATSQAISTSQPTAAPVQPATTVPPATAAAATNETATPSAAAGPTLTSVPSPGTVDQAGGITMGGSALGGNADTVLLAQQVLQNLPAGDLVWAAYETRLEAGEVVSHSHEFAFSYLCVGACASRRPDQRSHSPRAGTYIPAFGANRLRERADRRPANGTGRCRRNPPIYPRPETESL